MSLYDRTIPVFSHGLTALAGLLGKAEKHCEENRIDPSVLLGDRLFPDMLSFTRQVQIATDHSRRCPARLAGIDPVAMADEETTFAALQDRIGRSKEVLSTFQRADIDAGTDREISFKAGSRDLTFTGANYVSYFALPNFYFHMSIAHAILRKDGVRIGKVDFLGG